MLKAGTEVEFVGSTVEFTDEAGRELEAGRALENPLMLVPELLVPVGLMPELVELKVGKGGRDAKEDVENAGLEVGAVGLAKLVDELDGKGGKDDETGNVLDKPLLLDKLLLAVGASVEVELETGNGGRVDELGRSVTEVSPYPGPLEDDDGVEVVSGVKEDEPETEDRTGSAELRPLIGVVELSSDEVKESEVGETDEIGSVGAVPDGPDVAEDELDKE